MAILDSVKELASKLGAETNGRDITDQINKINKHLDETALGGRDIAEAVRTYSKHASGGGGGEDFTEIVTYAPYIYSGKVIGYCTRFLKNDENGVYSVVNGTDNFSNFVCLNPLKKFIYSGVVPRAQIVFTPSANFDGFYKGDTKLAVTEDSDEITPNDGVAYGVQLSTITNDVKITKTLNTVTQEPVPLIFTVE